MYIYPELTTLTYLKNVIHTRTRKLYDAQAFESKLIQTREKKRKKKKKIYIYI